MNKPAFPTMQDAWRDARRVLGNPDRAVIRETDKGWTWEKRTDALSRTR